jgi:hypothetical protein
MLRHFIFVVSCLVLVACDGNAIKINADDDSPEYKAAEFFYALLNEQDLHKTAALSVPKYGRIVKSYGSTKQFARNVLNMSFDEVTIEIDNGSFTVRKRYDDTAILNVILHGTHNGRRIADLRKVKLVRIKRLWYIEKVLDDPFAR